jgi:murein DD-endopeptidase
VPTYPFRRVHPITQPFGVPHRRYSDLGLAGHNGIDFGVPVGTEVLACESGEVIESAFAPGGFGYYVKIRTEEGADWLYAHLTHWHMPQPGEWVGEGAVIGLSGSSGMSTGPHLHLGWRPQWWRRGPPFDGYANPGDLIAL